MKTEVRRGRKFVEYIDDSLPVGTFVQEIGAHDVSYQDEGGLWHQLVEDWEVDGQDGFSFRASRMNHKVRFDSLGAWRWYPRRNVETEYIIINRPKCWLTRTNRWGNLLVNGISREGRDITLTSLRNVTRVIHSSWNGIKTDWILENENAPTRFQQQIDLVGLTEVGGWLYGADGEQVARLTPTIAIDAEGNELPVSTSYENGILEFSADVTGAVFPVVIDPDYAGDTADGYAYGYSTTYATARSTTYSYGSSANTVQVGQYKSGPYYSVLRSFLKFDTSGIPDTDTVTQVNLKLVCIYDYSTTDFDVQIVKQNWSAINETSYDNCLSGTADSSIWRNTNGISVNTQYASGNLATDWVNKTGYTYYSLRSNRDVSATSPSGNEYIQLASANHATTSYRPVLTVAYSGSSQNLTLTCAAGSYSLTGTNATLTHTPASQNLTLACNAGTYSLTGTNADLTVTRHYTLSCEAGSYALTGTNADFEVTRHYTLGCSSGSYSLTSSAVDFVLQRNYSLECSAGSYALSGTNADLVLQRNYVLECSAGSYSLTGADVSFAIQRNYSLVCSAGSYSLTGTDTTFEVKRNYTLACGTGSYNLTGSDISFEETKFYTLTCDSGSYLLSGTNATLDPTFHYVLECSAGSYALVGSDIAFGNTKAYTLACSSGSYVTTGTSLEFDVTRNYIFTLEVGAYSLDGTDAILEWHQNFVMACGEGAYSLTGSSAYITSTRAMALEAGTYELDGADIDMFKRLILSCLTGSYALTGAESIFNANRTFALNSGEYVLDGTDIELLRGFILPCGSESYVYTGSDISVNIARIFAIGIGDYILIGTECGLLVFKPSPECRTILAESVNAPMSDRNMRVSAESGEPMSDRNMRISAQSFAQQQCSRVYIIEKEQ